MWSWHKKIKPEEIVRRLEDSLSEDLSFVVLYGSAAAGDYLEDRSDYNLLVVSEHLGIEQLSALAPITMDWCKSGNPPPLLFTVSGLRKSTDTFPIEILDIKDSHQILFGEDILGELTVDMGNFRIQLERELKALLIQLREGFLQTGGSDRRVAQLLVDSYSTILVLCRAALRLFEPQVPPTKFEALEVLSRRIRLDLTPFVTMRRLRQGEIRYRRIHPKIVFEKLLKEVGKLFEVVDAQIHSKAASK